MYKLWQYVKPFFKLFFSSEDAFSFVKENVLLVCGLLLNMPIVYRHQLPALLNFLHLTGEGVEVGVRDGAYSEILLRCSRLAKLYSIDPWCEYDKETYRDASNVSQLRQDELWIFTQKRLREFSLRSEVIKTTSKEAASLFRDESLDFVYIDANHSYEAVTGDMELWWPKVKSGGVFTGHDYVNGYIEPQGIFGVKRAVDAFAKVHAQKVYLTPEKWPTWYIVKNETLQHRFFLYSYMRQEIREQYKDSSLWRQMRGIRSKNK